mmetsp:Transcript_20574/g.48336  ORF Transcript_20574/g.48336 Transcript_20574/m.48336 type:complete len:391 (+) Transcript_20574:281-1453(+)
MLCFKTARNSPFFDGCDFDASLASHCGIFPCLVKDHAANRFQRRFSLCAIDRRRDLLLSQIPESHRGRIVPGRDVIPIVGKGNGGDSVGPIPILQGRRQHLVLKVPHVELARPGSRHVDEAIGMQARGRVSIVVRELALEDRDWLQALLFGEPVGHDQAAVRRGRADVLFGRVDPDVYHRGGHVDDLSGIGMTVSVSVSVAAQRKQRDDSLVASDNDHGFPNVDAGGHGAKGKRVLDHLVDLVVDDDLFVSSDRNGEVVIVVVSAAGNAENPAVGGLVPRLGSQEFAGRQALRGGGRSGRRLERGFADLVQLCPDIAHGPQIVFREIVFESGGRGFDNPSSFRRGWFLGGRRSRHRRFLGRIRGSSSSSSSSGINGNGSGIGIGARTPLF